MNDTGKAVISHLEEGRFAIIFSFGDVRSNLYILNQVINSIDRIKSSIKRYLNITASFSIGNVFNDITQISKHYKDAADILKEKFYRGKNNILMKPSSISSEKKFMNLEISDEKNIVSALKSLDREKLKEHMDAVFNKILENKPDYKSTQMVCSEMINILNRVAREFALDVKLIYSDEDVPYEEMKKYDTIDEVKHWILNTYDKLIGMMETLDIRPEYSDNIKRTVEFICKNFMRNISLNDAAEYIGVNSSYLSRVFKEECGKGFVEYLNVVRVKHAKKLIESGDCKLKDIIKKVGFNNYTYFFKVFKKISGMTPLEYEEIHKSKALQT